MSAGCERTRTWSCGTSKHRTKISFIHTGFRFPNLVGRAEKPRRRGAEQWKLSTRSREKMVHAKPSARRPEAREEESREAAKKDEPRAGEEERVKSAPHRFTEQIETVQVKAFWGRDLSSEAPGSLRQLF